MTKHRLNIEEKYKNVIHLMRLFYTTRDAIKLSGIGWNWFYKNLSPEQKEELKTVRKATSEVIYKTANIKRKIFKKYGI